jgi:hypothetical protein
MTSLSKRKTRLLIQTEETVREAGRYREVVLEAHPYHASVRLKGLKTSFEVSWAAVYQLAVKIQVENERRAKKAAKSTR